MIKGQTVFVVGADQAVSNMFSEFGWYFATSIEDAALVVFTGGADVTPSLYGQHQYNKTSNNLRRDLREMLVFSTALKEKVPMVGICRGGQFLNVMCGGSLWQDVDGHLGSHEAIDTGTGEVIPVSSTHHQMMISNSRGKPVNVLLTALKSTRKTKCKKLTQEKGDITLFNIKPDIEALFYPNEKVLCFQPHPEYPGFAPCTTLFFDYVNKYLV